MALYAAPVWAEKVIATRRLRAILCGIQRRLAIRAVRAYRTTSHAAAMVLAGQPPLELTAMMYSKTYKEIRELQRESQNGIVPARAVRVVKARARRRLLTAWMDWLSRPGLAGGRVVDAVRPRLAEWVGRSWGRLSFRATQVMTGHGCFGKYLRRIGRERTAECYECGAREDSAQHTLQDCSAWQARRRVLTASIGRDLSLPAVVSAILRGEGSWKAFVQYYEVVMLEKEENERVRWGEGPPRGGRRGDGGNPGIDYSVRSAALPSPLVAKSTVSEAMGAGGAGDPTKGSPPRPPSKKGPRLGRVTEIKIKSKKHCLVPFKN